MPIRESCTSLVLEELALAKVISRLELSEICRSKCRSSTTIRVIIHRLSKLRLVYPTGNGYIIVIPWLMYLRELHGDRWIDVFRNFLRRHRIVIGSTELEDIRHVVEKHPIESLYDFVKTYLRFRDYVDKLVEIPSKTIPNYCKRFEFEGKDPKEIYLHCIAPLLMLSSWVLELLAELVREVVMFQDTRRVIVDFFEVSQRSMLSKDFYSEVLEKLRELAQFVVSMKPVREDPIERVVNEYSKKMKVSYDERSLIRNLLRSIALSKL